MSATEVELLKWLIWIGVGGVLWFLKALITRTQTDIQRNQIDIQHIKENYLTKADFKDFKMEIKDMFTDLRLQLASHMKSEEQAIQEFKELLKNK